ncbi:GntR family transcriptional regulator [Cellulomonas shaoxiangyii]|uniref:GntR family transcriptional regulator n=1 Tax=Cellulomonas shaoxiangyii TaxID=2566013 RepID=A0A4P7SK58_9CELL|nr:GntR family transcriptional regulator [Cellulomonas shaoxiangyii]QCB94582.1 GntR family transcriptional regulator [Cellulomonas shaoxiangyii]TGY85012.1 GntR family transcriptional regulator [Cellulomonas shaoxiangyii]
MRDTPRVGAAAPGRPTLSRETLSSQIRDHLLVEIAEGRIAVGARLRELKVAQELGTSQTPVREAFRELAALGLLETQSHTGTRVREVGERDLRDAVPVRAALEGLAGRLAAPRLRGAGEALAEALTLMEEAAERGDRLALASGSTHFHRAVVRGAGNDSLLRAWNALGIEVMTIVSLLSSTMPLADVAAHHRPIYDALVAGDGERAESVLADHVAQYLPSLHATPADRTHGGA